MRAKPVANIGGLFGINNGIQEQDLLHKPTLA
jgi:hypothetical protein